RRFLTAFLPIFLSFFIYTIFGPLDMVMSNTDYMNFHYSDVIVYLVVFGITAAVAVAALVALLKGKAFDVVLVLFTSFGLMSYVNGTFLNQNLGTLNGVEPVWENYTLHTLINTAICILLFVLPFVIWFFTKAKSKKIFVALCGILTGMQLVGLFGSVVSAPPKEDEVSYLALDEQFELASEGNVVIFLLDAMSNMSVDAMLAEFPDALEPFSDFTYYTNNNTRYICTFPSTTYLLTGHEFDFEKSYHDFFKDAWTSEKAELFYKTLADNGYEFNLYDETPYIASPATLMDGKIANLRIVDKSDIVINVDKIPNLFKLSAYRYVPFIAKRFFFMDYGELYSIVTYKTGTGIQGKLELRDGYLVQLRKNGLTIDENDKNRITMQYLWGPHQPFYLLADGTFSGSPNGSTIGAQTKGYMLMVEEYIGMMKELGIYDESTIIIMSDHGDHETEGPDADVQAVFMIKRPNDKHDSIVYNNAPTSHENFMPTMVELIGGDASLFGETMFEVEENTVRERATFRWMVNKNYPDIGRKYNVMHEYRYTGGKEELRESLASSPYNIYPLIDSFY
ncbi:MAG: hypothetical protein IJO48_05185, partial [Clostridia bacterium]|nr:hypothetical protein [Clostridia bacterium]